MPSQADNDAKRQESAHVQTLRRTLNFYVHAKSDLSGANDALDALLAERDHWHEEYLAACKSLTKRVHQGADAVRSLRTLRDAWNAHMETCPQHAALPELPTPTEDELRAWRDVPSNTASASIPEGYIVPEGDQRCGYVMDACRCMKRKAHDGLHACAHGGWNDVGAKYPPKAASGDLIGDPNFDPKGDDELSV